MRVIVTPWPNINRLIVQAAIAAESIRKALQDAKLADAVDVVANDAKRAVFGAKRRAFVRARRRKRAVLTRCEAIWRAAKARGSRGLNGRGEANGQGPGAVSEGG